MTLQLKRGKSKRSTTKVLHSVLKSLLADRRKDAGNGVPVLKRKRGRPLGSKNKVPRDAVGDKIARTGGVVRDDVLYIMSKDKMLIPQLTDEEALERHKRADETMKQVWSNIIDKYENVHTQGDVIDLHSGRIVEDNGHIRGLEQQPTAVPGQDGTLYNSATKKIMLPEGDAAGTAHLQDADNYSPWQVDPDDEDEMETQENILQGLTDDEDDDNGP